MISTALFLASMSSPVLADQLPVQAWPPLPPGCPIGTFVENRGQWPDAVHYLARVNGAHVRIEGAAILLQIDASAERPGQLVKLSFEGARESARAEGVERLEGNYGFFLGADSEGWQGGVPGFIDVRVDDVYEGIDVVVRERGGKLKYDLLLEAGSDPSLVRVRMEGAAVLETGDTTSAELRELLHVPGASWEVHPDGTHVPVHCEWAKGATGILELAVPQWSRVHPLVIDPELTWSTYLGSATATGTGDGSTGLVNDPTGHVVAHGITEGLDFPTTLGTYQNPPSAGNFLFATKVRRSDGGLVYSNLFGGVTFSQRILGGAVDDQGRAILGGEFSGTGNDFPTTAGAWDTLRDAFGSSGFVLRFSADGSNLDYSTYLEDSVFKSSTHVLAVALSPSGQPVVVGVTAGGSFPVTAGAYDTNYTGGNEGFVTVLDASASSIVASSLIGGSESDAAEAVHVATNGVITVAGRTVSNDFSTTAGAFMTVAPSVWGADFFVLRIDPCLQQVMWSTLIGGTFASEYGIVGGLGVTASGEVVFSGATEAADFPTTPGALSRTHPGGGLGIGFVSCFTPGGDALVYSTFLNEFGMTDLHVEPSGLVVVGGATVPGFTTTPGAYDVTYNGGFLDQGVIVLSATGDRKLYASFLGGPYHDAAVGAAFAPPATSTLAGDASSPGGFPTTVGALQPTFQGGQVDTTLATIEMALDGIELKGPSQPGCFDDFIANATEMPRAGAPNFGLYGSGAPASASGWLSIKAVANGGSTLGFGTSSMFLPVKSNRNGWVETKLPLSSVPAGRRFACQYMFRTPQGCTGSAPFNRSNVVIVTVQ